ncbi:MAG: hypothetical protein QX199_18355 [Methylococcaceae bacterium]
MLKKQRNFLRLRHAKEHDEGIRKNPLFLKVPPKKWLIIAGFVLSIALIIGGIIGVTYLPWFVLEGVTVTGTTTLDPNTISSDVLSNLSAVGYPFLAKDNVFLIRQNEVTKNLLAHFSFESVVVKREGRQLTIVVKEKVMTVALRTQEKTMFLNLDGSFARDATPEESHAIDVRLGAVAQAPDEILTPLQPNMPIVIDTQTDPATTLPVETVDHVIAIVSALEARAVMVKTFSIDGAHALFTRVDTTQPFDLFFDLSTPVSTQIDTLTTIQSKPEAPKPTEYIDLRFGAYVYVK